MRNFIGYLSALTMSALILSSCLPLAVATGVALTAIENGSTETATDETSGNAEAVATTAENITEAAIETTTQATIEETTEATTDAATETTAFEGTVLLDNEKYRITYMGMERS